MKSLKSILLGTALSVASLFPSYAREPQTFIVNGGGLGYLFSRRKYEEKTPKKE